MDGVTPTGNLDSAPLQNALRELKTLQGQIPGDGSSAGLCASAVNLLALIYEFRGALSGAVAGEKKLLCEAVLALPDKIGSLDIAPLDQGIKTHADDLAALATGLIQECESRKSNNGHSFPKIWEALK